jgi:hypothetical protein
MPKVWELQCIIYYVRMHTQTSSMIKKLFHQSIVVIDVIINFIPKKKVESYVVYC